MRVNLTVNGVAMQADDVWEGEPAVRAARAAGLAWLQERV